MTANELADELERRHLPGVCAVEAATMLRQQQAEIEALKKSCLDEIMKRVYADQTTKVMEGYWEEAQARIAKLEDDLQIAGLRKRER